jgi:hypothetical protein
LRAKSVANHKLGSCGYIGKRRVWREEDNAAVQARKAPDFSYLYPGHGNDFVRARVDVDRFTRQPIFRNEQMVNSHDRLMSTCLQICSTYFLSIFIPP